MRLLQITVTTLVLTAISIPSTAREIELWTELPKAEQEAPLKGAVHADRFAQLSKRLSPAVVHIMVKQKMRAPSGLSPFGAPFGFGIPHRQRAPEHSSTGTGFIIRDDGYIVTNNHVVEHASKILVRLEDEREFEAQLVGADPATDVALIKIDTGEDLPVAPLGDSDEIAIGHWVIAIGNPFGLDHTVTAGIISAKGRKELAPGKAPVYSNFIQTDASINPGNSGGPLINMRGEVVGINTAIIASGQGIGFAIPVNMAKKLLPQLAKGKVERAYLGVYLQPITRQIAKSLGLDKSSGALIAKVSTDSPADKAGLQAGDVVTQFNGKPVETPSDLAWEASISPIGSQAKVSFFRKGKAKTLEVTMGPHPDNARRNPPVTQNKTTIKPEFIDGIGIAVDTLSKSQRKQARLKANVGVVVTSVAHGSPAYKAGIRKGDYILRLGYSVIRSPEHLHRLCSKVPSGKDLSFHIMRGEMETWIALQKK